MGNFFGKTMRTPDYIGTLHGDLDGVFELCSTPNLEDVLSESIKRSLSVNGNIYIKLSKLPPGFTHRQIKGTFSGEASRMSGNSEYGSDAIILEDAGGAKFIIEKFIPFDSQGFSDFSKYSLKFKDDSEELRGEMCLYRYKK